MAYRMTFRSNPRLYAVILIMGAAVLMAVLFFRLSPIVGIVGIGFAGYIDYTMIRFLRKQMASTVTVREEGIHFNLYGEELVVFPWELIDYLGTATDKRGKRFAFAYRGDIDRLLVVSQEFDGFDRLVEELKEHWGSGEEFRSLQIEDSEMIKEEIKDLLGVAAGSKTDEEAEDPASETAEISDSADSTDDSRGGE